jgi:hypothetical protein
MLNVFISQILDILMYRHQRHAYRRAVKEPRQQETALVRQSDRGSGRMVRRIANEAIGDQVVQNEEQRFR